MQDKDGQPKSDGIGSAAAPGRDAIRPLGMGQARREQRRAGVWEPALRDLRFGWRILVKSPGFVSVAVLMLALGIGSLTAMFSTVRALVLEPFSSPQAERLVHVWASQEQPVSTLEYFEIGDQLTSFSALGLYGPDRFNVGGENPKNVHGVSCTPGVLRAFGVAPALGRWLEPTDEQRGAPPVAVISHSLWQQSFAGDPNLIGRPIRINGSEVTVVGIMPEHFEFCSPWMATLNCEIWRPFQLQRDQANRYIRCLAIGCLKEGVTLAAAEAELKAIVARLNAAHPPAEALKPFVVRSLRFEMTRFSRPYLWMIFGAAALLLLVACANVASMLLARSARRQGELGLRIALGATRAQIIRLAFSETLILSLGGTIAGSGLAAAGLRYFKFLADVTEARRAAMTFDGHALAFAAGLTLLVALFAGLPPALAALRISVADLLRSDSRAATGSRTQQRLLRGLLVAQIAIAFVLANLAVLFSASYAKLLRANAKLATDYVLSAELNLCDARYQTNAALPRFCEQLAERVAALPGVVAAGVTTSLPLEYGGTGTILVNDEVFDPTIDRSFVVLSAVTPGYFAAAGISVLQGRRLEARDVDRNNMGVVANRAFAEKYWPGQNPLGKIIRPNDANAWFHARVVGVVENIRQYGVKSEPHPHLYWTIDRTWTGTMYLILRSSQPATTLSPALRRTLAELDPDLPLCRVRTLRTLVSEAMRGDRVLAGLTNYCMIVAIALVAIGLYGTLSYHLLQRTREIGVRIALGATRQDVLRLIFRQGFGWVLMGIILGLGGALASAAALRAMVYDINTLNPFSLLAAIGAVLIAAILACWPPAQRVAHTDPVVALRYE